MSFNNLDHKPIRVWLHETYGWTMEFGRNIVTLLCRFLTSGAYSFEQGCKLDGWRVASRQVAGLMLPWSKSEVEQVEDFSSVLVVIWMRRQPSYNMRCIIPLINLWQSKITYHHFSHPRGNWPSTKFALYNCSTTSNIGNMSTRLDVKCKCWAKGEMIVMIFQFQALDKGLDRKVCEWQQYLGR